MDTFEKTYYESEKFWEEGTLLDAENLNRYIKTIECIPDDVENLADIGCGNGIFGKLLAEHRPHIETMSIDRSETALKYVKTPKMVGDINQIPLADNSYDCVSTLQVLEHIPVPLYQTVLTELVRVSKKYVLVSVPYQERLKASFTECPKCHSSFNVELHFRSYQLTDIQQLFQQQGASMVAHWILPKTNWDYAGMGVFDTVKTWLNLPKPFLSPICPVCGYSEQEYFDRLEAEKKPEGIKAKLKKVWPKLPQQASWIVAVYKI